MNTATGVHYMCGTFLSRLLREDFFMRLQKVDLKHEHGDTSTKDSASGGGTSAGKEGRSTLRKRGEKGTDSPRPKKQVKGGYLQICTRL